VRERSIWATASRYALWRAGRAEVSP